MSIETRYSQCLKGGIGIQNSEAGVRQLFVSGNGVYIYYRAAIDGLVGKLIRMKWRGHSDKQREAYAWKRWYDSGYHPINFPKHYDGSGNESAMSGVGSRLDADGYCSFGSCFSAYTNSDHRNQRRWWTHGKAPISAGARRTALSVTMGRSGSV